MLRIYVEFLGVLRGMRPVIEKIERRDSDLARQLRRAAASVAVFERAGLGAGDADATCEVVPGGLHISECGAPI